MKKRLINLQSQKKRLRWLSLFYALLLVPTGAWAELADLDDSPYSLLIAGTPVTDENKADILGDATISYDPESNVLTLNGATVEGYTYTNGCIQSGRSALTISVNGENTIVSNDTCTAIAAVGEGAHTLTIVRGSANSSLSFNANRSIRDFNAVTFTDLYWNGLYSYKYDDSFETFEPGYRLMKHNGVEAGKTIDEATYEVAFIPTLSDAEPYNLWIGGYQVSSANASDVLGDTGDGTLSFDAATSTLSFNNFFYQNEDPDTGLQPFITNGVGNLTIHFVASNTIRGYSDFLAETDDVATEDYTVSFISEETEPGSLNIFSAISADYTFEFANGLGIKKSIEEDFGFYYQVGSFAYDMYIGNIEVTTENASNITGESITGSVSFNGLTNTLTLNGATIEGEVATSLTDLTVSLTGDNSLMFLEGNEEPLTFTGTGTLTLDGSDGVIMGFSSVDFGDFHLQSSYPGVHWNEESNSLTDYNDGVVGQLTLTTATIYPVWVLNGENYQQVTETNKANVLGDGYSSVSYNGNGLLTVKGAQIASIFYPSFVIGEEVEALTVHLVGYNQIGGGDQHAFTFLGESTTLAFTTSETLPGCLVFYGSVSEGQSGAISCQNGLALDNENRKIGASVTDNTTLTNFTGYVSEITEQEGAQFMYTNNGEYYASNAELSDTNPLFVEVLSAGNATATAALWPSYLNSPSLINKVTFQFDWGDCENTAVTVQVKDIKRVDDDEPLENTWETDDVAYSEAISLATADADGIIEIPLTSLVASENIQLFFSSSESFSFVPLTVAMTRAQSYGIRVAGVLVSELNDDDVLGNGKVSFDHETNTLMLDNASIASEGEDPAIDYEGMSDLAISLTGNNTLWGSGGSEAIRYSGGRNSTPTLVFAKGDAQPCSLQLEAEEGTTVISSGFGQIDGVNNIGSATGNDLTLISDVEVAYDYQFNGLCTPNANQTSDPVSSVLIKAIYNIDVTFADRHWATYCAPANLAVPDGLEAYIVTGVSGTEVTVQQVDYLPQGMGVLLYKAEQGLGTDDEEYTTYGYEDDATEYTGDMLVAAEAATSVSSLTTTDNAIYVLYDDNFVRTTSGSIPLGRCYLPVSTATTNAEARLTISFGAEETGVGGLATISESGNMKVTNLSGQRVSVPRKGLYIIDGKKSIIK